MIRNDRDSSMKISFKFEHRVEGKIEKNEERREEEHERTFLFFVFEKLHEWMTQRANEPNTEKLPRIADILKLGTEKKFKFTRKYRRS